MERGKGAGQIRMPPIGWETGCLVHLFMERRKRRAEGGGLLPRRPGDREGNAQEADGGVSPRLKDRLLVLKQAWLRRILDILTRTLLGFDVKPCLDVKTHPYTLLSFP